MVQEGFSGRVLMYYLKTESSRQVGEMAVLARVAGLDAARVDGAVARLTAPVLCQVPFYKAWRDVGQLESTQ